MAILAVGAGALVESLLDRVPTATGVLFDLPHVVGDEGGATSPQLRRQAGDFFKDDLPACDAYVVMEVIHDWSDAESVSILRAIRRAAPPHATLLVMEEMVPEDSGPDWSKMLDIHMLALIGGKQRTRLSTKPCLVRQVSHSDKRLRLAQESRSLRAADNRSAATPPARGEG